jgi:hypothetical protein
MSKVSVEKKALVKVFGSATAYYPAFSKVLGDACAGIFVSRLFYWMDKTQDPDGWIYKTAEDMEDETGLTRSNQFTARKKARELGVVEEKLKGVPATMHYRVNLDRLLQLVADDARHNWRDQDQARRALDVYRASLLEFDKLENEQSSCTDSDKLDLRIPTNLIDETMQTSLSEPCKPLYTMDTTVGTSVGTSKGDQCIQDLPSPAQTQLPPQTALPVKVDEPDHAQPVQQQQAKHIAKTGDPMMDAAIAKHNGERTKQVKIAVDGIASRYRERGLTDVQFRGMVDAYLDEKCQLDIANGEGIYADRALSTAQEFIDALMGKGKRFWSLDAIRLLFRSWEANNKGMKDPSPMQLLTHAEQIVKGKVEKKVFANGVPAQSTRDADEKADADFWRAGGTITDIGLKYQVTERKVKPGTGRMDPKTCKWIEEVYLDEEPAVETQKAA